MSEQVSISGWLVKCVFNEWNNMIHDKFTIII